MAKTTDLVQDNRMMVRGIDRVLTVQRPVVLAHIRGIRRLLPGATPEQIIRVLERRYLAAVTTGGALVGASAAVPAIGTGASLALSAAETAGFLEASSLFAQSVTEIHGIPVEDPDRARTLVMTLVLGDAGTDLVKQLAGQVSGVAPARTAFWGELVTKNLPRAAIGPIADRIKSLFIKRFAVTQGSNVLGRLIPFGIGAAIGGVGNHLLGKQIVRTSREAFGPAPAEFPSTLDPRVRTPRAPKSAPSPESTDAAAPDRRVRRFPPILPIPPISKRNRGALMGGIGWKKQPKELED